MNWLVEANVCPGLFYGTPAQDGFLIRIRTPGGWLNSQQGKAIATWIEEWGNETIQVTNRANLQVRAVQTAPTLAVFQTLQNLGLAAHNPSIDHLRNIMCSPTAGIDCQELIDPRQLVQELDNFIQNYHSIAELSPKFSIGIDGGGAVGIGTRSTIAWEHRYNEIQLSAINLGETGFLNNNCSQTQNSDINPNLGETGFLNNNCSQLQNSDINPNLGETDFLNNNCSPTQNCHRNPVSASGIYFRLALGGDKQLYDTNVLIEPENCLSVVAALVKVYVNYVQQNPSQTGKKLRMKHLLNDWGVEKYLQQVNSELGHPLHQFVTCQMLPTEPYHHLGIHAQKQAGLSYIGLGLRLGKLTAAQLLGLVELSETFGSSELRLTPWQTILLPDIPNKKVPELLPKLVSLGLSASHRSDAAIVACAGKPGCAAAATQTQIHASILADYLNERLTLDSPVNIHLTGCVKSCAQPSPAEITLLGTTIEQNGEMVEGYQVYVGDDKKSLKYQIFEGSFSDILPIIEQFC